MRADLVKPGVWIFSPTAFQSPAWQEISRPHCSGSAAWNRVTPSALTVRAPSCWCTRARSRSPPAAGSSLRLLDVERLAANADPDSHVVFVPALAGLGAPYWSAEAKGTIFGITRGTTAADLARATLLGLALQVHDLTVAVSQDYEQGVRRLRVDGALAGVKPAAPAMR